MRNFAIVLLAIATLVGLAASAQASTLGTLGVVWNNVQLNTYAEWSTDGGSTWAAKYVNNGWATGTFTTGSGARNLGNVWCVDLYNYSGNPWQAEQFTQADGAASSTAWVQPAADDGQRSVAGLGQAAYLANNHGWQVAAGTTGQKLALQMAMWTAAYGTNKFRFTGNNGANYYGVDYGVYQSYVAEITAGRTASSHEWYDNDDPGLFYQDFMNDVPEPGSVLLLSGVLLGAAALGWRKRK